MASRAPDRIILSLHNVSYAEQNRWVLNNIHFDLMEGEVHSIVGEHRAGKTPLIQLINGELKPNKGRILYRGEEINDLTVTKACSMGICVVHQESQIIPNLSAVENILAGSLPGGRLKHRFMREQIQRCRAILNDLGCKIDLSLPMEALPQTDWQMVEIARLILQDGQILIFDDVCSRLTPYEMSLVIAYIKEAKARGKSVIFIDSDVDKVLEISDRVTVLHNGYIRGTEHVGSMDRLKLLKLTYNFALSYRDTAREQAQLQLEDFNEKIFSNLPAGVLVLNEDHRLVSSNQAARRILGLEIEALTGQYIEDLLRKGVVKQGAEIIKAVKNKKIYSWSNLVLNKTHVIRVKTMPNFDTIGEFNGTIILLEDITVDNSISEYLQRAEKISTVAEMAAGVSHEINNPLGIIKNYVQLLKYRELDGDSKEKVEKIDLQLKRINEITSSLLSFSRQQKEVHQEFDLVQLINEVILLLNYKIKDKNIELERRGFPKSFHFKGDDSRLRQVFVNLLNNSIEAVDQKGRIRISMLIDSVEHHLELKVYDNGYGIPLEIREDIFNPFYSTKVTKQNAGLGLSICQQIVEMHGGILTFDSLEGEYTEFKIQLPLPSK